MNDEIKKTKTINNKYQLTLYKSEIFEIDILPKRTNPIVFLPSEKEDLKDFLATEVFNAWYGSMEHLH